MIAIYSVRSLFAETPHQNARAPVRNQCSCAVWTDGDRTAGKTRSHCPPPVGNDVRQTRRPLKEGSRPVQGVASHAGSATTTRPLRSPESAALQNAQKHTLETTDTHRHPTGTHKTSTRRGVSRPEKKAPAGLAPKGPNAPNARCPASKLDIAPRSITPRPSNLESTHVHTQSASAAGCRFHPLSMQPLPLRALASVRSQDARTMLLHTLKRRRCCCSRAPTPLKQPQTTAFKNVGHCWCYERGGKSGNGRGTSNQACVGAGPPA